MAEPSPNVALLIDADNASAAHLDAVMAVLAEIGTVNIRRAYGNWSSPNLKSWTAKLHGNAIEPRQHFDLTKGKNATDMGMTIDAMDLLFTGRVDGFGIMSSDSDFTPLIMRIKQNGLPVYGFGTARTPEAFRQACTRFIDTEAQGAASEDEREDGLPAPAADGELVELLGSAWKAAKRDERGFAKLNEVGQLAGNRSSFDVRNYGHSRLSGLVKTLPNFTTETRDGATWIKRVR